MLREQKEEVNLGKDFPCLSILESFISSLRTVYLTKIKGIHTCYSKKPKVIWDNKNLESLVVAVSVFMGKQMVSSSRAI